VLVSLRRSVSVASELSVNSPGSVPRKIYLKGVSVSSTGRDARDAFSRPIKRRIKIPKIEKAPIRIGSRMVRSMEG
jgi:hypothetical protein